MINAEFQGEVLYDEPMRDHTTLRIGGPAEAFVMPKDALSLRSLLLEGAEKGIPVLPVGSGSNILVSDAGVRGAVVSLRNLAMLRVIEDTPDRVRIFVEAGVPLQRLINLCREKGYTGIEGLAGIPGSTGGAVKGNSGSFGHEIGSVVESAGILDRTGRIYMLAGRDIRFRYRSASIPDGAVILSATVFLAKDDPARVAERIAGFHKEKIAKQPVAEWSAGCVFKNPEGGHAGRLIDDSGCKGMRRGGVEVSSLHANYFINRGGGTAADFLALMEDVRERVRAAFGTELEPEIRFVGRPQGQVHED